MRPLLVGESNPYGSGAAFALFPRPERSAGGRLCRVVLGMREVDYLARFDRCNLLGPLPAGKWDRELARAAARDVLIERPNRRLILLGARVAAAFGMEFRPFEVEPRRGWAALMLPHPSGRCRIWNDPMAVVQARNAVERFAPEAYA